MGQYGAESFDSVIDGLRIGDNVVWQVDYIADYRSFVTPFVQRALSENRRVVYLCLPSMSRSWMRMNGLPSIISTLPAVSSPSPRGVQHCGP